MTSVWQISTRLILTPPAGKFLHSAGQNCDAGVAISNSVLSIFKATKVFQIWFFEKPEPEFRKTLEGLSQIKRLKRTPKKIINPRKFPEPEKARKTTWRPKTRHLQKRISHKIEKRKIFKVSKPAQKIAISYISSSNNAKVQTTENTEENKTKKILELFSTKRETMGNFVTKKITSTQRTLRASTNRATYSNFSTTTPEIPDAIHMRRLYKVWLT